MTRAVKAKAEKKEKVVKKKKLYRKENFVLWMMAMPGVILLLLFSYLPFSGIAIAFKNFIPVKGLWGSAWNGFDNFEVFFGSVDALRILRNTIAYSLMFIVVDVIFGLAIAIALYNLKSNIARKIYNTIMILPRFLSMVLIAYIVYGFLSSNGVVNSVLTSLGLERIIFYNRAEWWPLILTVTHVWASVGMGSVMYLAHLSSLDTTLVEAARIDGANRWHVIRHVYVPHLYPIVSILLILAVGKIFSGDLGLFYQVPMDQGALYKTTDIITTYVYRGLVNNTYGPSAAIGLLQGAVGCIMVVVTNLIVKKINPENSLF